MLDKQRSTLTERVQEALESGLSVAIIGWEDQNHNPFTRKLPATKRVQFFDKAPARLGTGIGYVIFTKYGSHAGFNRIKSAGKDRVHPVVVDIKEIREVLELSKELLFPPPRSPATSVSPNAIAPPAGAAAPLVEGYTDDVAELLTRTRRGAMVSQIDDKMLKFAREFLAKAAENRVKPGYVGKTTLGEVRTACGLESMSNTKLADLQWIVGEVSEGSLKKGWYKAGPKMLALDGIENPEEPKDDFEWVIWKAGQLPAALAERAQIEAEMQAKLALIDAKIDEMRVAEKAIEQVKAARHVKN